MLRNEFGAAAVDRRCRVRALLASRPDLAMTSAVGEVRHLSQLAIIGVLWLQYTAATGVLLAVCVLVVRSMRRSRAPARGADFALPT